MKGLSSVVLPAFGSGRDEHRCLNGTIICLVLYLPLFALVLLRSRYSAVLPTFSPPLRRAPSPSTVALTRVGFCMLRARGRRTRATRLRVLKNRSIKVFPPLFPAVTASDGYAPMHHDSDLHSRTWHMRIARVPPSPLVHPIHFCGRNSRGNCSIFMPLFSSVYVFVLCPDVAAIRAFVHAADNGRECE